MWRARAYAVFHTHSNIRRNTLGPQTGAGRRHAAAGDTALELERGIPAGLLASGE